MGQLPDDDTWWWVCGQMAMVVGPMTMVVGQMVMVVGQMTMVRVSCQMTMVRVGCQMTMVRVSCQMTMVGLSCQTMMVVGLSCQTMNGGRVELPDDDGGGSVASRRCMVWVSGQMAMVVGPMAMVVGQMVMVARVSLVGPMAMVVSQLAMVGGSYQEWPGVVRMQLASSEWPAARGQQIGDHMQGVVGNFSSTCASAVATAVVATGTWCGQQPNQRWSESGTQ
jgi:hypothetical protein